MTGQVNRYPAGLLSLIDAKTGGITPSSLLEDVRGTIELLPFYTAMTMEFVAGATGAVNAVAEFDDVSGNTFVPLNEFWLVWQHTAMAGSVVPVGVTYGMAPILRNVDGTQQATGPVQRFIAGTFVIASSNTVPFVMGPGSRLGVFNSELIGAGGNIIANKINFNRFRI